MVQPDVEIDDGTGRIIISSEEGETEENNDKTLSYFGLTDQSNLKCDDFFQNFELKITLFHCEKFDPQNTKEYELIADNQMLKDIQEQIKKENNQKSLTDQTIASTTNDVAHVSPNLEAAEKKRRYEQAFCDEEATSSSGAGSVEVVNLTKKLKSSENSTNSIEQIQSDDKQQVEDSSASNSIDDTSKSVNDASDALSEEDYQLLQKKEKDSIQKGGSGNEDNAILVDDDCIIEENLNDDNSYSPRNNNGVITEEDDDQDIIECSGDEDIIEINDDSESNVNEKSNGNNLITYQLESNGNHLSGHFLVESENESSSVEVFKHKKILAANNLNGQSNNNTNGNNNGHLNTNSNGNGNGKHSTEEDEGFTVIE